MASDHVASTLHALLGHDLAQTALAARRPALVWSARGDAVLWASPNAPEVFGLPRGAVLSFDASTPAIARLREFARTARPGDVRRDVLRFRVGARFEGLKAENRLIALTDGALAILTFLGEAGPAVAAPTVEPLEEIAPLAAGSAVQPPAKPPAEPTAAAEPPAAPAVETSVARPLRVPGSRPVRFIFQTDAEGLLSSISPSFAQALGVPAADVTGKSLIETVRAVDAEGADALAEALTGRGTWSGVRINWPSGDGEIVAPVELSAAPTFGADRSFGGFSGFGVCRLDRARQLPPPPAPAPEPTTAEPTTATAAEPASETSLRASKNIPPAEPEHLPVAASPAKEAVAPSESGRPGSETDEVGNSDDAEERDGGQDEEISLVTESPAHLPPAAPTPPPVAAPPSARPVQDNAPAHDGRVVSLPHVSAHPPPGAPTPKVVPLKTSGQVPATMPEQGLTNSERHAFREIARALGARFEGASEAPPPRPPAAEATAAKPADPPAAPEKRPIRAEPVGPSPVLTAAEREEMVEYPWEKLARIDPRSLLPPAKAQPPAPAGIAAAAEAIVERIPVGVLVFREEQPLHLNRPMLDMTGYATIEEFRALGGLARLFPGRPAGGLSAGEYDTVTIMGRDGQTLPVDAHLQTIEWDGAPASLVTFRRAIDAEQGPRLRSLEVEMKARRADLAEARAMLDTATDGVISLDDNGRILALNRSAEALFGYDQKELAGERFTLLLAPESHAPALDYLDGLKSGGVASVLNDGREVVGKERKGGRIPLFMTVGRVSETGKFAAVVRDMTAWKRAEAELTEAKRAAERASALKSDFLAKISHEIRTPMNAIIGFAEVMRDERLGPIGTERYKEYLKDIHTSGEHVISLVNDLLDLSKIEAGRMDLTFGSVDLNAIVTSCIAIMQPQANRDRVIMRSQIFPKLPPVVADERSIRQIVLNLLSNASKFTEPGGQVIVSTALTEAGEAVIRVRDTGIGMTDQEVQAALEPFRQLSTTRHRGGTGLGLPLTKALVEANRATFSIRSKSREGTLVEVTFPPTRVLAE
jgi:PAS domain S-box-containing protein